jgi:hypothetical protein
MPEQNMLSRPQSIFLAYAISVIVVALSFAEQKFFPIFAQAFSWIEKENENATLSVPQ